MVAGIDDGLRGWWEALLKSPAYQCDEQLLALGRPALERVLDCIEGKANIGIQQTFMEWRDWGNWPWLAVKVFANADLGATLDALVARGWTDERMAYYVGSVRDPRVLPYLVARLASKEPIDRAAAVRDLAGHRDPRAVDALISVLRDRSPDVRAHAAESLGVLGDRRAIEPLQDLVKRNARSPVVLRYAEAAIVRLQRKRK
jgi:HEAT repeat protein